MDVTTTLAERIPAVFGATFFAYGLISRLNGRMDMWQVCGYYALAHFFIGISCTLHGAYPFAALAAGLVAFNGHTWWTGGGEQQVNRWTNRDQA